MIREEFISKIDEKIKQIRVEQGYTQDKMANILGISKKTLIQVEKGRSSLGWAVSIAVCTLFKDSEVLQLTFGGDTLDIILSISFDNCEIDYNKTLGGKVFWTDIKNINEYRIQQNIISKHCRLLDPENKRICSSFDFQYLEERLNELI